MQYCIPHSNYKERRMGEVSSKVRKTRGERDVMRKRVGRSGRVRKGEGIRGER